MKTLKVLLVLLLFYSVAHAGEYICYEEDGGSYQVITEKHYSVNGNHPAASSGNCMKIDRPTFNALTKYHVVDEGAVREMTQPEKDAFDAVEAEAQDTAMRNDAKAPMDDLNSMALIIRALADIIREEINILRAEHSLSPRTLQQLKTAIKNKIDSGEVD